MPVAAAVIGQGFAIAVQREKLSAVLAARLMVQPPTRRGAHLARQWRDGRGRAFGER